MSCNLNVATINSSSYIGNSLAVINSNFTNLLSAVCAPGQLYDRSQFLSQELNTLNSRTVSLSAALLPAATKAWVLFSGSKDEANQTSVFFTNRKIYNKNNVFSVYRLDRGQYRITFEVPLETRNYLVLGTSSIAPNNNITPPTYGFVSLIPETRSSEEFDVIITNNVDPDFISIAVF